MGPCTVCILFLTFLIIVQNIYSSEGDKSATKLFKYTLNTKLINSITTEDEIFSQFQQFNSEELIRELQAYIISYKSNLHLIKRPKIVKNLYSTLKHFIDDNCLIVVNNFEEVDIHSTIEFPIVLTKLDIAVGSVSYFDSMYNHVDTTETVWIPKEMIPKLNGNFSIEWSIDDYYTNLEWNCTSFKHLYSIWKIDTRYDSCISKNLPKFFLSSRSWQCKIQVDLFMPDNILRLGKHTEIFPRHVYSKLKVLPSLRPPVHIFVNTKTSLQDYDSVSLAAWIARTNERFAEVSYFPDAINDVQISAHVTCNYAKFTKLKTNSECNIDKLNVIYPCPECPNLLNAYTLEISHVSFEFIANLEKSQKSIAFPTTLYAIEGPKLTLPGQIYYYLVKDHELIKLPLKNIHNSKFRFSDKIELLGFGYASIFSHFLGNLTSHKSDVFKNQDHNYFTEYLCRQFDLSESYNEYNSAFRVKNDLGNLHFVSCGSRGIEPFPFLQFVSVFNWEIWVCLLICIVVLSIAVFKLYKSIHGFYAFSTGITNLLKVLLEQGNPFPPNLDASFQAKCVMTGIFLAALVISNAFKSENVYKIVLPRLHIPYYNIKELVEDKFTIYTRLTSFSMLDGPPPCNKSFATNTNHEFEFKEFEFKLQYCSFVHVSTEFKNNPGENKILENAKKYARMHSEVLSAVMPTWKKIDYETLQQSSSETVLIWWEPVLKLQDELILSEMSNCSKTAWMLPNYLAQNVYRSLRKSGKHSDVSVTAYTSKELTFGFYNSYVPSSILKQFAWISTTGLLEWWPRFVNRSDLVDWTIDIPKKPNMSGNILVIFVIFGSGVAFAITCFVLEFWRHVVSYIRIAYKILVLRLRNMKSRFRSFISRLQGQGSTLIFVRSPTGT